MSLEVCDVLVQMELVIFLKHVKHHEGQTFGGPRNIKSSYDLLLPSHPAEAPRSEHPFFPAWVVIKFASRFTSLGSRIHGWAQTHLDRRTVRMTRTPCRTKTNRSFFWVKIWTSTMHLSYKDDRSSDDHCFGYQTTYRQYRVCQLFFEVCYHCGRHILLRNSRVVGGT